MEDKTQQAILTLSRSMRQMAQQIVGEADFPRFYSGQVLKMVDDGRYEVALGDQVVTLPVYGGGLLKLGQYVFIVSPYNSKEISQFWILSPAGGATTSEGSSEDHELILQLVRDCANKVDKGSIMQTTGSSETNVMSQKAVTDALDAIKLSASQGLQGVRLGITKLIPDSDSTVTIPVAKENMLGVVLSKTGLNHVVADDEGAMTVDSLDVMKLEQKEEDTVVLDGSDQW